MQPGDDIYFVVGNLALQFCSNLFVSIPALKLKAPKVSAAASSP